MAAGYITHLNMPHMRPTLLQPLGDGTLLGLNMEGVKTELHVIAPNGLDDVNSFLDAVVEKLRKTRFGTGFE